MSDVTVSIGSWFASGGHGSDGFFIAELSGVQGGGVGVKADRVARPLAHGDYDVPVFREARVVSLEGICLTGSAERQDFLGRQLLSVLGDGSSGRVVFRMPGGAMWGDARLADSPEFEPTLWGQHASWLLQLRFANPRLFGESRTFASGAPAYHFGNFTASPVFTVSGDMPSGYTIAGAGRTFTTSKPLVSGTPHVVDMSTGYLTIGGVVQTGVVSSGDTWGVPAGSSVVNTLSGSGTGTLSVRVVDTFI